MAKSRKQKHKVGGRKADGENLYRGKTMVDQYLGAYKTCTPEDDGANGQNMPDGHGAGGCLQRDFHGVKYRNQKILTLR